MKPELPSPILEKKSSCSEESPLVLIPPCAMVAESFPKLYLANCIPAYRREMNLFSFAGDNAVIPVTEQDKTVSVCVSERVSGKTVSAEIPVKLLNRKFDSERPLSILLIEDKQYKRLNLSEGLSAFFGQHKCSLDSMQMMIPYSSSFDFAAYQGWKAEKYDAIIMNILLDPIARPWSFPFQSGPFLDDSLSGYLEKLQKKYPDTPCFIILPPPPVDEPSFYTLCYNSPQLSRLSHYRVCDAVQRWFTRKNPKNVYLIPLYLMIDPENDYRTHTTMDGVKIYSGYALKPEVNKRLAEIIGLSVFHCGK